jgi:hypothetical protein
LEVAWIFPSTHLSEGRFSFFFHTVQ